METRAKEGDSPVQILTEAKSLRRRYYCNYEKKAEIS